MKRRILSALLFLVPVLYIATRDHTIAPADRAKALCRGQILKQLKDAENAKFGNSAVNQTARGDWVVYREVTANNSFGAAIRSTLVCNIPSDFSTVTVARARQP